MMKRDENELKNLYLPGQMGLKMAVGFLKGFDETVGTFQASQIVRELNKTEGSYTETVTNFTMEPCTSKNFDFELVSSYNKERLESFYCISSEDNEKLAIYGER
jgi:hypothetical protein